MPHECMDHPIEYAEQDFDCNPIGTANLKTDDRINNSRSCELCRAPITPPGDFGFYDWDTEDDEPEWVALCWGCARGIVYSEMTSDETGEQP